MKLTEHFSLEEFYESDTALRLGIDNKPDAEVQSNLTVLSFGLERVRSILGSPMHISSGYRCPQLNKAIGGSSSSQHMQGLAADFTAPEFGSPLAICNEIVAHREYILYDQVINEGRWVHISFQADPRFKPRGEVLTAHFSANGVRYSKGLA
jgi:hypothetical protein